MLSSAPHSDYSMQVKDILAYLQLVDNPAFLPAFNRVVNVPSRTVGEKVCRNPESLAYP